MNFKKLSGVAWKALLRNKTRSLLTMLGIIIGIGSVIAMVGIGQSSSEGIGGEISEMGTNTIFVTRASQTQGGVNIGSANVQTLKESDVDAILKGSRNISMASPSVSAAGQLVYGANNWPGTIQGANSNFLEIRKYTMASGSNITERDVETAAKVCIIGKTVANELFPDEEDPLGKVIRFKKIPLKVIGVLESKGQNMMGQDQDDIVIAPYTTVQKRILAINYLHMILASSKSEAVAHQAAEDVQGILREQHKIQAGADDDFEVFTQQQMLDTMNNVTGMLTILLTAIAAISLLVGGIGIMNIMYVTVTERTREIGLRMAIGAKNRNILMQFLAESTILSLIGGVIGLLLGLGLSFAAASLLNWPFIFSTAAAAVSFVVCAAIGIFFGWYPARKAANLDPINALRFE
ncbi:MAG: ABC transporter permease [Bacteroidales bacterium]|jgi:putative ABC transport system permease protein|nr:ABC transporter permease [Bacteroidales bacterium]